MVLYIHQEVFRLKKVVNAEEDSAARTAAAEAKRETVGDAAPPAADPDGLTALRIRLALSDSIDYELPPVIGD